MPPDLAKARRPRAEQVIKKRGRPHRFRDKRKGIILDNDIYPVFDEKKRVVQLAVFGKDITKEVRVANFLRQDKSTKEIVALMDVSTTAVSFHRDNIRKKLGIKNKRVNLRIYLMTLT
jgi:DNA-binding CsgD family transcriptional regulator